MNETPNVEKDKYKETVYEGRDVFELIYNKKHPKIMLSWGKIYKREIYQTLEANGVRPFSKYDQETQSEVTAKLLSLDGVEFCSVQKRGNTVRVEIRQSVLPLTCNESGDLIATRSGIIQNAVVLGGTLLKKPSEEVAEGESLVGGYIIRNEEVDSVRVVAKVCLLCVERVIAESEEQAYSQSVLLVESLGGEWKSITYEQVEEGIQASVEFTLVIKKNM